MAGHSILEKGTRAMREEKTTRGGKYQGLLQLIKKALEIMEQDIQALTMDEEPGTSPFRKAGDKCKMLLKELEEELATIVRYVEEAPEQSGTENCSNSDV
jgi:hypothetical protein